MKITPLISAMQGIQRGMKDAGRHAAQIANPHPKSSDKSSEATDVAEPLVGLVKDQTQVAASAKVVRAVDEMIGSLLDEKA